MARILLTQPIHPQAQARLAELGEVVVAPDTSRSTLRRAAAGCAVVIVRALLPDDIFDAAPSLIGAVRHGNNLGHQRRRHHPGFVDDEDVLGSKQIAALCPASLPRRERAGLNAAGVL